ncbi:hypothetical protein EKD04_025915, partial [Chloroflexales bacterium ZM16-3]|nr:hypothetical protein [Chloroflexales bacterium ZM16-3]
PDAPPQLRQACDAYLVGLERTYRLTCYVAILAVIVGTFLPGWPFAWEGRQRQQGQPSAAD